MGKESEENVQGRAGGAGDWKEKGKAGCQHWGCWIQLRTSSP